MISVLVLDDHPLVRIGAAALLRQQDRLDFVGVSKDPAHAAQLVEQRQPDVVLLGLQQGASVTNEATRQLLARYPAARVLVLAERVHAGGDAGLYFAIAKQPDRLLVGGWILHPDGTQRGAVSRLNTRTLSPLTPLAAPTLDPRSPMVQIGGDTGVPPVVTEPQPLVVIDVIAILIALLVPAVQ